MNNTYTFQLLAVTLSLFAGNTNVTTQSTDGASLSAEMKTYYSDYLIDNAEPELVHAQFGQKRSIPKNGGKTVEFRKFSSLPKQTTALTEGVTPDGQKLNVSTVTANLSQYGGYIEVSDILQLTAVDNNLAEATRLLGSQAGRSVDTVVRDVLNGGTNVQYAEGQVNARASLVGGAESGNHYLTVDAIRRAVRTLKVMNAPKCDGGCYVGIIHPDCAYDLMNDPKWINVKSYSDPDGIYNGEIGKIEGVRFVETSEAMVFDKAGASNRDVYSTLILGGDAYGVVDLAGGGLEHIYKPLGSAGAADPLNQRATAGWKVTTTAVRLVEEYMVRIETASTFSD